MSTVARIARDKPPVSRPLLRLASRIDAACAGPMEAFGDAMTGILASVSGSAGLLSPWQVRGQDDHYARHVVHADPAGRFTIVSIVWRPGQATPIHAHYTWCAYAVVIGSLREEAYRLLRSRRTIRSSGTCDRATGYVSFSHAGTDSVHRIRNCGDAEAVSIHVYGIDGARVATHVNHVVPDCP